MVKKRVEDSSSKYYISIVVLVALVAVVTILTNNYQNIVPLDDTTSVTGATIQQTERVGSIPTPEIKPSLFQRMFKIKPKIKEKEAVPKAQPTLPQRDATAQGLMKEPAASKKCIDSDYGGWDQDYFAGTTSIKELPRGRITETKADRCSGDRTLIEYECMGTRLRSKTITCEGICREGKCTESYNNLPGEVCIPQQGVHPRCQYKLKGRGGLYYDGPDATKMYTCDENCQWVEKGSVPVCGTPTAPSKDPACRGKRVNSYTQQRFPSHLAAHPRDYVRCKRARDGSFVADLDPPEGSFTGCVCNRDCQLVPPSDWISIEN